MTKLSEIAKASVNSIYQRIIQHPFNQELMRGTLSPRIFSYYLNQDKFYMHKAGLAYQHLAKKVPESYRAAFTRYAEGAFASEKKIINHFLDETSWFSSSSILTSATLQYTDYLLNVCQHESPEIGVAASIPCFWIYLELGFVMMATRSQHINPYAPWINTYHSDKFKSWVEESITIFDTLADRATKDTRQKMLTAFMKSTQFEYRFFHQAYHGALAMNPQAFHAVTPSVPSMRYEL